MASERAKPKMAYEKSWDFNGVTGVANDEGAEDCSNTSTGTGNADGGGTSTNELGGGVDVTVGNRDGEWASGLNGQTAWGGKDDTVHIGELIKVSVRQSKSDSKMG